MEPKLRYSCPEPWENMRIGIIGRHCAQCDKQVLDFTRSTKADLVAYLLANQGHSICGRVRRDQVDAYQEMMEVLIQRSLRTNRRSNVAFYLIAVTGLSMPACNAPDAGREDTPSSVMDNTTDSSTNEQEQDPDEAAVATPDPMPDDVFKDAILTGVIIPDYDQDTSAGHVSTYPEVMPEFPGGTDSLYVFLRKHVTYPKWESEQGLEGRVIVKFTVLEDGSVTDPIVLRSVEGSRNFDSEVLRVIALMPKWKPGETHGEPVKSTFALPFNFKLNAG